MDSVLWGGCEMGNHKYLRNLCNKEQAEEFARNILELPEDELDKAAYAIKKAENLLVSTRHQSSLTSESERVSQYKSQAQREKLYKQITNELFTLPRLDDDDKIKLGSDGGGALPKTGIVKSEKKAYIITGLPASGKSQFASLLSDEIGGIILDNDYAKRKIPEYYVIDAEYSANFVHKESSLIVLGEGNKESLLAKALELEYNMIIPTIGYDAESLYKFAETLTKVNEYEVHLILVSLDRQKATQRAYSRFSETKRYVPLSLIFDSYANDPILTYYRLKGNKKYCKVFKSFGKISTDVAKGDIPIFVDCTKHCLFEDQNAINRLYKNS